MNWFLLAAASVVLLTLGADEARAETVLVYPIEDARSGDQLDEGSRFDLQRALHDRVESDSAFEVVAFDEEEETTCYTRKCQLAGAQEEGAPKVFSTRILRMGTRCAISSRLLDVTKRGYERGATRITPCTQSGLISGFDLVVLSISRQTRRARGEYVDAPIEPYSGEDYVHDEGQQHVPSVGGRELTREEAPDTDMEEDIRSCRRDDAVACTRAAYAADYHGDREAVVEWGRRGCRLGDFNSCRWAIKAELDRGRKKEALVLARRGCRELDDGGCCGWGASIETELGHNEKAFEYALRGCRFDDADACSWAAKIEYDAGNYDDALEHTRAHCTEKRHGAACRWAASIQHARKEPNAALSYAQIGCEVNDGPACSWAARIESELGHKELALSHANKGMTLGDVDAYGWVAMLESGAGRPERALSPARIGCQKHKSGVACSWAASLYFDQGDREAAREAAAIGAEVGDVDCAAWLIKIDHESGNSKAALETARRFCDRDKHPASCRWVANIAYELDKKRVALKGAKLGCDIGDGPSCSWVARIEYEADKKRAALKAGERGCTLNDADSCSWAAKIESEAGNKYRALGFAQAGCELDNDDACEWVETIKAQP